MTLFGNQRQCAFTTKQWVHHSKIAVVCLGVERLD